MKKIYRATCRFDKRVNDFRQELRDRVNNYLKRETNDSEITRTIYEILLNNDKLRESVVKEMMVYLGGGPAAAGR